MVHRVQAPAILGMLLCVAFAGCVGSGFPTGPCDAPNWFNGDNVIVPRVDAAGLPELERTGPKAWRLAERIAFDLIIDGEGPEAGTYPVDVAFLATADHLYLDINITIGPYLWYGRTPDDSRQNQDRLTFVIASTCADRAKVQARAYAFDLMHEYGAYPDDLDGRFNPNGVDPGWQDGYPVDVPLTWRRSPDGAPGGAWVESSEFWPGDRSLRFEAHLPIDGLPHPAAKQHLFGFHLRRHDAGAHEGIIWNSTDDLPAEPGPFDGAADFWPGGASNPGNVHNTRGWRSILLP